MTAPTHGARIEFVRATDSAERRYDIEVRGAEDEWSNHALFAAEGDTFVLGSWSRQEAPPPAWVLTAVDGFLRTLARGHREEPFDRWPRKLVRWRAPRTTASGP